MIWTTDPTILGHLDQGSVYPKDSWMGGPNVGGISCNIEFDVDMMQMEAGRTLFAYTRMHLA